MAEASISIAQDQLSCPVCLDLLKDPVTVPCGHSYCMSCITAFWDQEDQRRGYSCPQCRQTFTPRPALSKNVVFAEMVEKLRKTQIQTSCYAGPGDVECDICSGVKYKAVRSCLECLESYCQTHFERHEEFRSGKRHKVTDATGGLQAIICPQHQKILEIFCRTDQKCICKLCAMYEHKNHFTVSAEAQKTETEKRLMETQRKFKQSIQKRMKDLQELREAVKSHKKAAQKAVEDSERIFTELIHSIERSRFEVTQLIRDQEKVAADQAKSQLERLEQEIDDLRRRDAELGQLSHTQDDIHFLQSFQALSEPPKSTDSFTVSHHFSFDGIIKSVCALKEKLKALCEKEIKRISAKDRGTCRTLHQQILQLEERLPGARERAEYSDPVAEMVKREARPKNRQWTSQIEPSRQPSEPAPVPVLQRAHSSAGSTESPLQCRFRQELKFRFRREPATVPVPSRAPLPVPPRARSSAVPARACSSDGSAESPLQGRVNPVSRHQSLIAFFSMPHPGS